MAESFCLPAVGHSPGNHTSRRIARVTSEAFVNAAAQADTKQLIDLIPLLPTTVNVNARREPNAVPSTALHVAAEQGHEAICELLLAAGADPACGRACRRALTPLHVARSGVIVLSLIHI